MSASDSLLSAANFTTPLCVIFASGLFSLHNLSCGLNCASFFNESARAWRSLLSKYVVTKSSIDNFDFSTSPKISLSVKPPVSLVFKLPCIVGSIFISCATPLTTLVVGAEVAVFPDP